LIFIAGKNGVESLQKQHESLRALQSCVNQFTPPIYSFNHYGALPWMNPSPLSFVLAYNYWQDRKDNRTFEHNGIGGLIQQGYFNTLILPAVITTHFDAGDLSAYQREPVTCMGFAVFTKRDS